MKKPAMVLVLVLMAGSAMADGGYMGSGGGRGDDTGAIGSGCCAASSQDDSGWLGSGGGRAEDGGHLGSGVGAQSAKGAQPGAFARFYSFLLSLFA